jgi:hypothetical protein
MTFNVANNAKRRIFPLSMGGLGIDIASLSAESAFVSSVGATFNLQRNMLPRAGFSTARAKLIDNGVPVPLLIINEQPTDCCFSTLGVGPEKVHDYLTLR